MKKFIILVLSAFTFLILYTLGMIALTTNTWGLNIDTSGLFSHMTVTLLEVEGHPTEQTYKDLFDLPKAKYYIENNSGEDITLQYNNAVSNHEGELYSISLYAFSQYLIDYQDNTFKIESIPDDYDYYFSQGRVYSNKYASTVQLSIDKYSNVYPNSEQVNGTTYDVIIKDGEKHEIKLP